MSHARPLAFLLFVAAKIWQQTFGSSLPATNWTKDGWHAKPPELRGKMHTAVGDMVYHIEGDLSCQRSGLTQRDPLPEQIVLCARTHWVQPWHIYIMRVQPRAGFFLQVGVD